MNGGDTIGTGNTRKRVDVFEMWKEMDSTQIGCEDVSESQMQKHILGHPEGRKESGITSG